MQNYRILAINPGSTSTKITIYQNEYCVFKDKIDHSVQELSQFPSIASQKNYRKQAIMKCLSGWSEDLHTLGAVVGRGGFLPPPLFSGTYLVDEYMVTALEQRATDQHAANLGAILAKSIGDDFDKPAYTVDPVGVNETWELGTISGYAGMKRRTMFHCLNVKAVARKAADILGKPRNELNFVIAHLGGGVSISSHLKGRTVDSTCGILGEGAFSPERAGTLGEKEMITFVLEQTALGRTRDEMERSLCGGGGLVSYLGTNNALAVEDMIQAGDEKAKLLYEAMAYQIAKDIGAQSTVLAGKVDAIVITGGLAFSDMLFGWIEKRVCSIAPVLRCAGEFEHEAMTLGVLRVLDGTEEAKTYR